MSHNEDAKSLRTLVGVRGGKANSVVPRKE
jgi:hypothetical protein